MFDFEKLFFDGVVRKLGWGRIILAVFSLDLFFVIGFSSRLGGLSGIAADPRFFISVSTDLMQAVLLAVLLRNLLFLAFDLSAELPRSFVSKLTGKPLSPYEEPLDDKTWKIFEYSGFALFVVYLVVPDLLWSIAYLLGGVLTGFVLRKLKIVSSSYDKMSDNAIKWKSHIQRLFVITLLMGTGYLVGVSRANYLKERPDSACAQTVTGDVLSLNVIANSTHGYLATSAGEFVLLPASSFVDSTSLEDCNDSKQ